MSFKLSPDITWRGAGIAAGAIAGAPRRASSLHAPRHLARGGHQWLPVSASIRARLLVTYRAPAAQISALLPAPLTVDARYGFGFLSVCALDMADMGIVGLPSWLRFQNREFLYRVGVRVHGQPSFFTLRSDVSSRALALLGRFSHYRLRHAEVTAQRSRGRLHLVCRSRDGLADGEIDAPLEACAGPGGGPAAGRDAGSGERPASSSFASAEDASRFLLGMTFSVDVDRPSKGSTRVRVQDIEHDPWGARFVQPRRRRFDFVERLGAEIGAPFAYDHTLAMSDLQQTWRASRWI